MRIALIGNSHAAMLIAAHRQDPRGETLTVFAKPSLQPEDYVLDGSVLRATSDDLRARLADLGTPQALDLAQCDAVVIAGLVPSAFAAVRLAQGHVISHWPSAHPVMARILRAKPQPKDRPLMSKATYRAALMALTDTSPAATLARGIQAATGQRVLILPQPLPSEALLEIEGKYPIFRRLLRDGDGAAMARDLDQTHLTALDALPGLRCLVQPDDTRRNGCLTAVDLMRGGPRLSAGTRQAGDDVLHGNATLGAVMLSLLRAVLAPADCAPVNCAQSSSNP
jgi:hypothetical protein